MWREGDALVSSTSFLLLVTRLMMTGKLSISLFFLPIHITHWIWANCFLLYALFCCQGVWEERGGCYRGSGQPGVCERSHGGLHQWADPLLLPGAQESPGRSRLLLWQLVLRKAMTPLSPPVLFIDSIKYIYTCRFTTENSEHTAANHW